MADPQRPPRPASPGVDAVERRLRRLRARARWLLVIGGASALAAGVITAALSVGMLDYVLRLPAWLRVIMLAIGLGLLVVEAWRRVAPAVSFRPSLTDIALRLEGSEAAQKAGLRGVLASGLELAREESGGTTRWMASHVVDEAEQRFAALHGTAILRPAPTLHSLMVLAACVTALLSISMLLGPRLTAIGAARVLAPWAGVEWPKRTQITDATNLQVHPINTALPLRASLQRSDRPAGQTRVWASYRLVDEKGAVRRVQLTGQGKRSIVTAGDGRLVHGELYERLIEPASLGLAEAARGTAELEYWFETSDDQTEPTRIRLVEPPQVAEATVKITPPAYAAQARGFMAGSQELGAGNDQRAIVGPILAGSHIELAIRLNKTVPVPPPRSGEESARARTAWLASTFPGADLGDDVAVAFDGARWMLGWTARHSTRLPVVATDEFGLKSADEASFAFDIAADGPPTAAVLEPREDESVLPTAIVPATGEGRDDVGLAEVSLARQLAKPPKGSAGAPADAAEPPVTILSRQVSPGEPDSAAQATVSTTLELAPLDLHPGEELWLTAVASDNYEGTPAAKTAAGDPVLAGNRHEPVRSSIRRLRIIKEEELIDQVRAELGALRKVAIRLDEDQAELQKPVSRGAVSADDRHRQSALAPRISQQGETVKRLQDRIDRNQLKDDTLAGVLKDVDSLLKDAGAASQRASAGMDTAAQQSPDPDRAELEKPQQEQIAKDQDAVRDHLARLAEMLDKGEDTWAVSRTLQRLAQQQRDLKARTERAGEATTGKKPADLTAQERAELADIAERQQRLADQARQAIDQLEQRSQQLKQADASQAAAMKQAAERGRQQQVPQKMEEAAKQAGENQTSQAEEQQQQAADALEQMLQDMQEAQKNRDATLRRLLADLIQSLDALIVEQAKQIEALAGAAPTAAYTGLDKPMIALNQNTLGVADKARSDRAMARVASLVDRAGKNQEGAITALRASPVAVEDAEQGEKESHRLLVLARAEAQKLKDDASKRDAQKKRQELRQAYRESLEEQAAIKAETDPYIGKPVERRERIRLRGTGEKQESLRQKLADLKAKTAELAEAGVFEYAHQRLEQATSIAGKKLRAGQADRAVQRNQESAIRVLSSLVLALDEQLKRDDDFREGAGGGGGSGGGGQQPPPVLPPLAELRLLRAMQAEAGAVTRSIDEAKESAADELGGLGDLQRNLARRGDELIQKMQQQKPGNGEIPLKPVEDKKPAPPKPEGGKNEEAPGGGGGG